MKLDGKLFKTSKFYGPVFYGQIREKVDGTPYYMVTVFKSPDGIVSHNLMIPLSDMKDWRFFDDNESFSNSINKTTNQQ